MKKMQLFSMCSFICLLSVLSDFLWAAEDQWSVMIRPKARIINSVWGISGSDVFAVGNHGTILRYDGSAWQMMESPTEANLTDIWGTGKNSLFAVGDKGTVLRCDGTRWQQMNSPTETNLKAVRGNSTSGIFAVGENGTIIRYDGTVWTAVNSPAAVTLYSMWESLGTDIFAVGGGGTILRYDGTAWHSMSNSNVRNLRTVWGFSSSDVYAAGSGSVLHYDGRNWQTAESNFYPIRDLWGSSGTDLYAVGASLTDQPVALWYNGKEWKNTGADTDIPLNSIWGDGKGFVLAAGGNSQKGGIIYAYNGQEWQEIWCQPESDLTRKLYAVYAFSEKDVFAVGEAGAILHYDGSQWSAMESGTENGLLAVWGISGTDFFTVGEAGTILHYDGTAWQKVDSGITSDLYGIWGYADNSGEPAEIFAVGDKGTVLHGKNDNWEIIPSGVGIRLEGIWGIKTEKVADVFAAGNKGVILRYDGSKWQPMESPVEKNIRDIWGYADENSVTVFAAGDRITEKKANFLCYEGMQWAFTNLGQAEILQSVWGSGETDIFIAGKNGFIRHYDGKTWNPADRGKETAIVHMHGIPKAPGRVSQVFGVDADGAVLQYTAIAVFLPEAVKEGGAAAEGTVLLPYAPAGDTQISLLSDDTSEITVPAFITIPAGQTSAVFLITVSDDAIADGTRNVIIRASGANCNSGSALIRVHDNESAVLNLGLPDSVFEGDELPAGSGILTVSPVSEEDLSVSLHSSHPDRISVPRSVTIPADQGSVRFDMLVGDDTEKDNTQTLAVTASVNGWTSGSAEIQVADNDRYGLTLSIPDAGAEKDKPLSGTVSLAEPLETDLLIHLAADDTSELMVPETVTIPAGSISAAFELSPVADYLSDNPQSISLTADAPGFASAEARISITDSEGIWQSMRLGSNMLRAVWGSSEKDVFAVGWDGMILHYDGVQWKNMDSGTGEHLRHMWGYDGNTVFAVGGDTSGSVIVRCDGSTWSTVYRQPKQVLNWVWGISPDNVWAVGKSDASGGMILHWDGVQWKEIGPKGLAELNSIWGTSASDIFVSGTRGQILHWDGFTWTSTAVGTSTIRCVWGNAGNDVFAIANDTILHYDGAGWSEMEGRDGKNLYNIWGTGPDNIYITGNKGTILHYDGKQWQEEVSGTQHALWGIWGFSADNIFISGAESIILHNDGTGWKIHKDTDTIYNGIWCFASENGTGTEAFAVGDGGSILHCDTSTCRETEKGFYPNLNGIWGRSPWEIYAVGNEGTIVNFNGTKWHKTDSRTYVHLYDIHGLPEDSGRTDLFAAGDKGTVLHFDGQQWERMETGTDLKLQGIWVSVADTESGYEIFAAGWQGIILHFDGSRWHQQQITTKTLYDIWGSSAADIYASGAGGGLFHYDGYNWHGIETGSNTTFRGIWGSSASDVYVPGYGMILHYDGSDWIQMSAPGRLLNASWGLSEFDMFAAGYYNTIVRYTAIAIHIPEQVNEQAGILSAQGRVSVSESLKTDLAVRLTSHDFSEVSVPDTVVIPAGQRDAVFDLTIHEDAIADGTQRIAVTTAADGYSLGTAFVHVLDNETAVLKIQVPEQAEEGDEILSAQGAVFLQTEDGEELTAQKPVRISLTNDCPAEIRVPNTVTVPAGQSVADFDLTVIDDTVFEGPRIVRITASVEGWTADSADMEIIDNEKAQIMLEIPDTVSENDAQTALSGTVSVPGILLWDLTVDLVSDRNADLAVPDTVTIPAGQSSADFRFTVNDDPEINGERTVNLTASAPGWDSAETKITVKDNDPGEIRFPSERFRMWKQEESILIPVCRYYSSDGEISVCYTLEDSSGIPENGTLLFENREKEKQIAISRISERGERLRISLSDPGGGAVLGTPATAEIMLIETMAWKHESQITENHLRGIWGTGSADIFAVGWRGTILHYDGSMWSDMSPDTAGNPVFLEDVWGSTGKNVFAVGHNGIIGHYEGEKWGAAESGTNQHLYAIWGPAGAESGIFAAGSGILLHYDGSRWNKMQLSIENPDIRDIWGENANSVYAVGTEGLILHYDGQNWRKMECPTANHLYGVWGNSGSDVFAVGANGAIVHYDGTAWQEMQKNTDRFILFLESVWGQSANSVFAAGSDGIILHYDGTAWSEYENFTGTSLSALWGPSGEGNAADIFAVGENGTILHLGNAE